MKSALTTLGSGSIPAELDGGHAHGGGIPLPSRISAQVLSLAQPLAAGSAPRAAANLTSMWRDYPRVLAAAFVIAEVADTLSALVVRRELNPIIGVALPLVSIALKVALVCFVLAVVQVIRQDRPLLARLVLVVGVVAGLVGAISNTHLTPFHG
jgi:hypothetical protein